jgi:hypothetical protein
MPGVRETFRASGPSPRCTAVREKQPNSSAFRGRSASRETVARWRLGGASGIRTLGTLRCSGSRSRWDYILRWDSRCRRWTGTTGVLLSEPGQSPGKIGQVGKRHGSLSRRSGCAKESRQALPEFRRRCCELPGRMSRTMSLAPVRCAWCCGCPIPRRLRML